MSATSDDAPRLGWTGRVALACVRRRRVAVAIWLLLAAALASQYPQLHGTLSGAGWEALGSESLAVRDTVQDDFPAAASSYAIVAVVRSEPGAVAARDAAIRRAAAVLRADPAIGQVLLPQQLGLVSGDGRTAVVAGAPTRDSPAMVRAAERLRDRLGKIRIPGATVERAGLPAQWADFNKNHAEQAERAEILALPVTLIVLVLAFGTLTAAGIPLLLTLFGLSISGGILVAIAHLTELSIWSQNFASIFTLALGIDYSLFVVVRYREARREHPDRHAAIGDTMDTAGKAVVFSGLTVLSTLAVILIVPNTMLRSVAIGILISVALVLAMVVTLLPIVLDALGPRIDRLATPWPRRPQGPPRRLTAWANLLWRRPLWLGIPAVALMIALALPVAHLRIGVPDLGLMPKDAPGRTGAEHARAAFGPAALGPVQVVAPAAEAGRIGTVMAAQPALGPATFPLPGGDGRVLVQAPLRGVRDADDSGRAIRGLRAALPPGAQVGGVAAEVEDFRHAVARVTPPALAIMLGLAFVLTLVAFQSPVIALLGTATSALSTGAAFGVTVSMVQDGHLADLIGLQSQGFLDFWVPLLFFAMIFAISMDYTVFLLSAAREHWERSDDAETAVVQGVVRAGPVIIPAAAVMIGVFFTFSVADSLAAKEFGAVMGVAVIIDAFLVRLLVLPAAAALLGRRAWWQPAWLGRILPRVSFGHGDAPGPG